MSEQEAQEQQDLLQQIEVLHHQIEAMREQEEKRRQELLGVLKWLKNDLEVIALNAKRLDDGFGGQNASVLSIMEVQRLAWGRVFRLIAAEEKARKEQEEEG